MIKKRTYQWNLEPTCNNGQNQNIDVDFPKFPIGPVHCKNHWSLDIEQADNEPGNYSFIKLDLFEEMLQATIVRCMERLAGKLTRQMRETHDPAISQTKQGYCHGGQSGLAQVEMRA